jgi:hypothetical protein
MALIHYRIPCSGLSADVRHDLYSLLESVSTIGIVPDARSQYYDFYLDESDDVSSIPFPASVHPERIP